jgi:nucleotide-binding universal stress UspA family protein
MTEVPPSRRIVVGVDGSAASIAAVRWAVREAGLRGATIQLVCAYQSGARLRAPYASAVPEMSRAARRATAQEMLDRATQSAVRHLPAERVISDAVDELPVRALLDRAKDAELLVLGATRPGRQPGQPPAALGPVARSCLRLARCPVVVVAPDDPPTTHGGHANTRVTELAGAFPRD